jgi:hypothetical protein
MVKEPALLPNKASILFPPFVTLRLYIHTILATVQTHGSAQADVAVHLFQATVTPGLASLPRSFLPRHGLRCSYAFTFLALGYGLDLVGSWGESGASKG